MTFPQYPSTTQYAIGSNADALNAAKSNYFGMNLSQHNANVAREIDANNRAVAQANQEYQWARANEATGYNRQVVAQAEADRAARQSRSDASSARQQAWTNDYYNRSLKQQDDASKLRYGADPAALDQEYKMGVAKYINGLGTDIFNTPAQQIMQATGAPKAVVEEVLSFAIKSAPEKLVSHLNAQTSKLMLKLKAGQKLDPAQIASMKNSLPQNIQDMLIFSPTENKWIIPLEGAVQGFHDYNAQPNKSPYLGEMYPSGVPYQ